MPPADLSAPARNRSGLLRTAGFVVAVLLGAVGVWLIVTSTSQKGTEIGILTGLWGLLLGSYAVFGSRLPSVAEEQPRPEPSRELDLRRIGEIERSAVAAARQEFRNEMQLMLQRELQSGFARELSSLRTEVTALRHELVEKVGGQLRLERIETTRLIGSDLEALQGELRKLRERTSVPQPVQLPLTLPATPTRGDEIQDAEIVPDDEGRHEPPATTERPARRPAAVAPPPSVAPSASPKPASAPSIKPVTKPVPHPVPHPVSHVSHAVSHASKPDLAAARPAARPSGDPFASLPRITPFTDVALDPAPAADGDNDGRRSRRHRADDGGNDVLARILAREQH